MVGEKSKVESSSSTYDPSGCTSQIEPNPPSSLAKTTEPSAATEKKPKGPAPVRSGVQPITVPSIVSCGKPAQPVPFVGGTTSWYAVSSPSAAGDSTNTRSAAER